MQVVYGFYVDMLEHVMRDVTPSHLLDSLWLVAFVASVFYALFLFDTLGSAVGAWQAMWCPLVMVSVVPATYLAFRISDTVRAFLGNKMRSKSLTSNEEVEEITVV